MSNYTVWKIQLNDLEVQTVQMPAGSEILFVANQFERFCIWFRCDPAAPQTDRTFAIVGTGFAAPPPEEAKHIGTVVLSGGRCIFHVFEKLGASNA